MFRISIAEVYEALKSIDNKGQHRKDEGVGAG
jgi:hypothetical protein